MSFSTVLFLKYKSEVVEEYLINRKAFLFADDHKMFKLLILTIFFHNGLFHNGLFYFDHTGVLDEPFQGVPILNFPRVSTKTNFHGGWSKVSTLNALQKNIIFEKVRPSPVWLKIGKV